MNPNDIFTLSHLQQDIARATQGDVSAAIRTGYRYFTGLAGKRDAKMARFYFLLGAQGVADASPWIHYLNFEANHAAASRPARHRTPIPEGTFDKLGALAKKGDIIARTLLGRVQERGWNGAGKDLAAAKRAYVSVGAKFALAQTFLGELYFRQGHVKAAVRMFTLASEKNETRALVNLALIAASKKRAVAAKQLLKKAAVQNDCRAMHRLALLYRRGIGGSSAKPELARKLFQQAARIGYPSAISLLRNGSPLTFAQQNNNHFTRRFSRIRSNEVM